MSKEVRAKIQWYNNKQSLVPLGGVGYMDKTTSLFFIPIEAFKNTVWLKIPFNGLS